MLLYEKVVNGVKHIYGTLGKVPTDADQPVIYKDKNGTVLTDVTYSDRFRDDKAQGMNRESDGKNVTVWVGSTMVIPPRGQSGPQVESLAFTTAPAKTSYKVGEALDMAGAVVTATYSDQTTADVTASCTFTPATIAEDTTVITAEYLGKTATTPITVIALNSIAFTADPKVSYFVGDAIDLTGAVVTATYADSSTADVTASCTFVPAAGTAATTAMTNITASFGGKEAQKEITVREKSIYLGVTDAVPTGITGLTATAVTKEQLLDAEGYSITLSPNNQFSVVAVDKALGVKLNQWYKPGLGAYTHGEVTAADQYIYYLNGPDEENPNPYPGGDGSAETTTLYFENV